MSLMVQKIVILVVWQYPHFHSFQLGSTFVVIIAVDCVTNMFHIIIVFGENMFLDLLV
jgi:uncharacterized membrane protein YdfJ with MMPL/SSD domain